MTRDGGMLDRGAGPHPDSEKRSLPVRPVDPAGSLHEAMQGNPAALRDLRDREGPHPRRLNPEGLARFHGGDRAVLEDVYRSHFESTFAAVGSVLSGADRETATHEVFFKLLYSETFRRSFQGGDMGAWLAVVARNHAIDYVRRRNRESPSGMNLERPDPDGDGIGRRTEARMLIDRFCREVLPPRWLGVFQTRFLDNLSQAEAASRLGTRRTTLAYQELRIRQMLRKFLLEDT